MGRDGMTAYERRRGRRCRIPVVRFGEKVWCEISQQGKNKRGKLDSSWAEGLWLGHARSSNEHLVGTADGVFRSYTIKRQSVDAMWDGDLVKAMRGTPFQPNPAKPGRKIPIRVSFDEADGADGQHHSHGGEQGEQQARRMRIQRMRITSEVLKKYGYTDDCEGCRLKRANLSESRNHTEACRARIQQAMQDDPVEKRRFEDQQKRFDNRMVVKAEVENGGPDASGSAAADQSLDRRPSAGGARGSHGQLTKPVQIDAKTTLDMKAPAEEDTGWENAWDDVSGKALDPAGVRDARAREMKYIEQKRVWRIVSRADAVTNKWPIVATRWIDCDKGDAQAPKLRSRLVAKEFNSMSAGGAEAGDLFAATPPLEGVRVLISEAATAGASHHEELAEDDGNDVVMMINDVSRAFFEAPMRRWLCVELPPEADQPWSIVGILQCSLYGTRDAAAHGGA